MEGRITELRKHREDFLDGYLLYDKGSFRIVIYIVLPNLLGV